MPDPITPPVTPEEPVVPESTPAPSEDIKEVKDALAGITEKLDSLEEKIPQAPEPEEEPKPSWKPNSWDDIPALVDQKVREGVEQTLKEREEAASAAKQAEEDRQKAIDAEFDKTLSELETAGKLPKIADPASETDAGRTARKELFGFAAHLGTLDLKTAHETLERLHESGVTFDHKAGFIKSNPKPAGAEIPVGSSSRATGSGNGGGLDYNEMHTARSFDEIQRLYERKMGS